MDRVLKGEAANAVVCGDCLEVMAGMPDSSVDLIATDPPYFKVKDDAWDRQWDKPDEFLKWLDLVAEQFARILKPNGSLYLFASPQMAARVEVLLSNRFNILNHLVWAKTSGLWDTCSKESLRSFFPQTERIIFAEHYGADNMAKGEAGYVAKCDELRGFVFEPLRAYIAGEFERAGMLNPAGKIAANVACGFSASAGGMASRHYFGTSQWQLPTREHYDAMASLLNTQDGDFLRREYDDLRREYDDLRRPFAVTPDIHFTDVWTFGTVPGRAGRHPCEKPLALMEHIVAASSRPGDVVFDPFAGSGTTLVAARNLGREYVGVEMNETFCEEIRVRVAGGPLFSEPT